jgi:copper resistance protein D
VQITAWDVVAVAIKAILYAATLCAAGGVFFLIYDGPRVSFDQRRRIRRWVGLCILVALLTSVVRIVILAGSLGEGIADGAMVRMVLEAGEGRATGVRIAGLLLTGTAAFAGRRGAIAALPGALLSATSFAWIGHVWAANHGGLSIALLSLHLIGVAFWLGALVPLLLIVRDGDLLRIARSAARFGNVAVIVVLVLIAAGATLVSILLAGVSDLWTNAYGRTVTVKIGCVACLLSVAAFNKLHLTPRLLAGDSRAVPHLSRWIRVEMLVGSLILTVTAILTTLMGPPALE